MGLKIYPKNVIRVLPIILIMTIIAPFLLLLNPSVFEATNPSGGECDLYYGEVFLPCISLGEALIINFKIMIITSILILIVILFVPERYVPERYVIDSGDRF